MVRKWDPFRDLLDLHEQASRLMEIGQQEPHGGSVRLACWRPAADVSEDPGAFYLHIEVPGVSEESISLVVEDRALILRGDRCRPRQQGSHYLQSEIPFGPFERKFYLPSQVSREKISAHYKNGILEVVIPKKHDPAQTIAIYAEE